MEFETIRTTLRGGKFKKMEKQNKIKVTAVIFMAVLFTVALFVTRVMTLSGLVNMYHLIGSNWLTQNNTGLLAVCGVMWWQNHILLVFIQVLVLLLGLGSAYFLFWGVFLIFESVAIVSYMALLKIFPKLEKFEELGIDNILSMLMFEEHLILLRKKTPLTIVSLIFWTHVLFFVLAPVSVILWLILWCIPALFVYKQTEI